MAIYSPPVVKKKNPSGSLRIDINWKDKWLDGHTYTLKAVTYSIPSGITKAGEDIDLANGKSTLWVSGGTDSEIYRIVATATVNENTYEAKAISVDIKVTSDV